ncbi:gastrula zinc finger protein XlCGF57.1 isoform X1 [Folsomia candida]|nr:gastrula zinc finger protein XlCGF57.1 isoform X1 [Folsomia candida]
MERKRYRVVKKSKNILFLSNRSARSTGKEVSQHSCSVCGKIFMYKTHVIRHLEGIHKWPVFPCRLCNRKFFDKGELDQHVKDIHKFVNFPCLQCGNLFHSHDELDSHVESTHPKMPTEDDCPVCGRRFQCQGNANRHLKRVHKMDPIA